jgi:rubredoxin
MKKCPKCGREKGNMSKGSSGTIYYSCSSCAFVWIVERGKGIKSYLTETGYKDIPEGCLLIFREKRHK